LKSFEEHIYPLAMAGNDLGECTKVGSESQCRFI
jgi:hypothetical protein